MYYGIIHVLLKTIVNELERTCPSCYLWDTVLMSDHTDDVIQGEQ